MRNLEHTIANALFLAAMLAAVAFGMASAAPREPHWPTQGGTPIEANFGCLELATETYQLAILAGSIASATNLGDYLPAGCTGFEGRVTYGDVILAHETNLATGSFAARQGKLYASGSQILWTGKAGTFQGKFLSNGTTAASITIDLAW